MRRLTLALLSIGLASSVTARPYDNNVSSAIITSASIGFAQPTDALKADIQSNSPQINHNNSKETGLNLNFFLGYLFGFNRTFFLGPEVGFSYDSQLTKIKQGNNLLDTRSVVSFPIVLMAELRPFYIGLNLFAKVGFAFNNIIDTKSSDYYGQNYPYSIKSEGVTLNPYLAIGMGINLARYNFFLQGSYNNLKTKQDHVGLFAFSIGVSYRFPVTVRSVLAQGLYR